jgi:hypothetical protein
MTSESGLCSYRCHTPAEVIIACSIDVCGGDVAMLKDAKELAYERLAEG